MNRRDMLKVTASGLLFGDLMQKDNYHFVAKVAEADKPNLNRRIYPKEVLQQVVSNFTPTYGHLGLPTSAKITLSEVSHMVNRLYLDDNNLMADIEVINTPNGKTLKKMIDDGVKVYFRTSGIGSVDNDNDKLVINESYRLISIDAVENGA